MGQLAGSLLQASAQNAGPQETAVQDLVQYFQEQQAERTPNEETRFFEALGAWVAGDLLKGVSVTPREREVVDLIATGHTNKEIARRLSLSVRTVERHSSSVMNKLGLQF